MVDAQTLENLSHIARLSVLAMAVRAVAAAEFESGDGVRRVVVTVTVSPDVREQHAVDVVYFGASSSPIAGYPI
jgi:hypothetical protein